MSVSSEGPEGQRFMGLSAWAAKASKRDLLWALQRYEALATASAQTLWVADPEGHVTEISPSWLQITGLSWEDAQGDGWLDVAHPEDREKLRAAWFCAVADLPEIFEHSFRLRHADGGYRHVRIRAVPVRRAGRVSEWVGACTDVEDEWLRERRNSLIGEAARAVADTRQAPDAFATLSTLIVPELADECGIYLLPDADEHPSVEAPLVLRRVAAIAREGLPPGLPPRRDEPVAPNHALARAYVNGARCTPRFRRGKSPTTSLHQAWGRGWSAAARTAEPFSRSWSTAPSWR
ncbi:PAS domain S-box protein [Streptomyces sp. ARC32]